MSAELLSARLKHLTNMLDTNKLSRENIEKLLNITDEYVSPTIDDVYMLKCLFLGYYIMENIKSI